MKKILYSLFVLLGFCFLFVSCDFMSDVMKEVFSDVDTIGFYPYPFEKKKSSIDVYPGDEIEIEYKVAFKESDSSSSSGRYQSVGFIFYSSDDSIADVDTKSVNVSGNTRYSAEGSVYVTAKKEGTCTITMEEKVYKTKKATVTVNVKPYPLKLKEHKITLDCANPEKRSQILEYTNTSGKSLIWTSTSKSVVKVNSSGVITAERAGSATINVSTSDYKWEDSCEVTVVNSSNLYITIDNENLIPSEFYPGMEVDLKATVNGETDGISKDVYWQTDDSSVVSVDVKTGHIKAVSKGTAKISAILEANENISEYIYVTVIPVPISANQFFWGNWTRMDKGTTYVVEEKYVLYNDIKYLISSSTEDKLEVETLGTFTKDSDNVIKWHDNSYDVDVPFYRQGGVNLKYKVRVVGFEDAISRAAGTDFTEGVGKKGLKVKGQSERYSTYVDEGTTDDDGYVELTAPVQGDSQTLSITNDDGEITVVSGLKIENGDDFMGTIPVVKKDEYSLKITGSVADSFKTNGYLYANDYKSYPLTLTISNISKIKSETAIASISCTDPNVKIELVDSEYTLNEIMISSMKPDATKTIKLNVSYGELASVYKDIALDVRVKNLKTKRVWVDYVPLRFFAGDMPISIAGKATERNPNTALNGFVIYPDGNSKFFTVSENSSKTLYVPVFGKDHMYEMIFSGATVTGELSDSTEMYYTVAFDSVEPVEVELGVDSEKAYNFGESNDSEKKAFNLSEYFAENGGIKSFKAYLSEGDIDFYQFCTDSSSTTVYR